MFWPFALSYVWPFPNLCGKYFFKILLRVYWATKKRSLTHNNVYIHKCMPELQVLEAQRALTLVFEKHAFKAYQPFRGVSPYCVDHASISQWSHHTNFHFTYRITSGEKERRFVEMKLVASGEKRRFLWVADTSVMAKNSWCHVCGFAGLYLLMIICDRGSVFSEMVAYIIK